MANNCLHTARGKGSNQAHLGGVREADEGGENSDAPPKSTSRKGVKQGKLRTSKAEESALGAVQEADAGVERRCAAHDCVSVRARRQAAARSEGRRHRQVGCRVTWQLGN